MAYRADEHVFTTSGAMLRIAGIAATLFSLMALLTWHGERALTLVVGGGIVTTLFAVSTWFWRQERHAPATLFAEQPFESTKPFRGYVEAGAESVGDGAIRVDLYDYHDSGRGQHTFATQRVAPEQIRRAGKERVHIPFAFAPQEEVGEREVYLRVRTRFFPFGWGATFRLHV